MKVAMLAHVRAIAHRRAIQIHLIDLKPGKLMEAKEIEKYKSLDSRENQKQKLAIEKAREQLQKITDKLN